jgi:hypothetical protein
VESDSVVEYLEVAESAVPLQVLTESEVELPKIGVVHKETEIVRKEIEIGQLGVVHKEIEVVRKEIAQ